MDIKKFKFPVLNERQIAFSVVGTNQELLQEAKLRGFYNGSTPYNDLFNSLFYKGGNLNYRANLNPEFKQIATRYLRALMGSFEPRHEDKEAICALLLSELAEV